MAKRQRLTNEVVETLAADPAAAAKGNATWFWDDGVIGLAVKITPTGSKTWVYVYRTKDGKRPHYRIGACGRMTASAARQEAKRLETAVRNGRDPQTEKLADRGAETIKQHAEQWLAVLRAKAKRDELSERTVEDYASKVNLHIIPTFGGMKPADLTATAIKAWRAKKLAQADKDDGKRRPGVEGINGVLRVLSALCSYMKDEVGVIGSNPAAGLGQFTTKKVERYLTVDEMARLGTVLDQWRVRAPHWVAVVELALLTGMRKGEALTLRWDEVDEERGCIVLKNHKTKRSIGAKTIYLGEEAREVLERAKAWKRSGNPYVFPSVAHNNVALKKAGTAPKIEDLRGPMSAGGLKRAWTSIRREAGLKDDDARLRFHDLRHSFASTAVSSGIALPVLGKSLGHSSAQTTARYAHVHDAAAHAAAQQTSAQIKSRMARKRADTVAPFPGKSAVGRGPR